MTGDSPQEGNWAGELAAGGRVAGYRIEAPAGVGGMAVVYRARDERLQRAVALKVMAPALSADPGFRQRFIRESRAAAAVDDPHILPVYEAGEADGVLFIAMRFVSGGDLRSLAAREGQLPAARVAAFIAAAASALDAAHAAGLVHRDVKPANMLVDSRPGQPDHLYLSDFGLSKGILSAASASLTGSAEVFGTPDYLAPEQAGGAPVDGRADQYALACTAFTLLAGHPVFERDHPMAVLLAHMSAPPPSLTSLRPDLPAAAEQVLAKALAKSPGDRYPSCGQFATALGNSLDLGSHDATVAAAPTPQPERSGQPPAAASPVFQGEAMEHAQTITAVGKGSRHPDPPAGQPGMAAITAPAVMPGAAQRPAWRRPVVAAAVVAIMSLGIVALVAAGLWRSPTPKDAAARGTDKSPATLSHRPPPTPVATTPPVAGLTNPGVVADCTRLSTRPPSIALTCPDDGSSTIQNLTWTSWGASAATGQGTFQENLCTPSCSASTTFADYPVKVGLSEVRISAPGHWFSRLTVTWQGKRPSWSTTMLYTFPLVEPSPGPSTAPTVTRVCSAPIYPKCQQGGASAQQLMQVEPTGMSLSGDGTGELYDIVWQHWGSAEAVGTGQYGSDNCRPNCGDGVRTYRQGQVLATDLVPYDGGMAYNDVTLEPAGETPEVLTGTVP